MRESCRYPARRPSLCFERLKGNHPAAKQFGAVRQELRQKVEADRTDPLLLLALAFTDTALEMMERASRKRCVRWKWNTISENAVLGPTVAAHAKVFVWDPRFDKLLAELAPRDRTACRPFLPIRRCSITPIECACVLA